MLEDYKTTNKLLKPFGGACRKKPGSFDTVIVDLRGVADKELFEEEYRTITSITLGGDIAKIEWKI